VNDITQAGGHKIIFTGVMGAGKTTAISAISDTPVVATEAVNSDRTESLKEMTTVAMDLGEIRLDSGMTVRLYGTPGQERFSFMWRVLGIGALGIIVLLDNRRRNPVTDMLRYLDAFPDQAKAGAVVVGVSFTHEAERPPIDAYYAALAERGLILPVFAVDVRQRDDVLLLVDTVISNLEAELLV
jgi:uncharacterized protein